MFSRDRYVVVSADSTSTLVHVSLCIYVDVNCKELFPVHCCFLNICMRCFGDSYTPYFLTGCRIMRVKLVEGGSYTQWFLQDMYVDLS